MGIINPKRLQCTLESCWRILSSNPKTSQRSYALSSRTKLLVLTKFRVEFWKNALHELASPLCRLFRLCFANGTFPDQWKTASAIPVHKRDSKSDPTKYRPISLLSIISKVMESAVNKQLQNHLLSPISWSLADNLASDHIIAPPTFSPSLHRLGMHL